MDEKILIEFSGEEFDFIRKYWDLIEAKTVQVAILNAVSIALDEKESET